MARNADRAGAGFGMNWDMEQAIGALLAGASFAFILGVVIWDQIKYRWPFVYLHTWSWKRRPKRRKPPRTGN